MKKVSFNVKKWSIRALTAAGAALGLASCFHPKTPGIFEKVYGPAPPPSDVDIEIIEDVYGPPQPEIMESDSDTTTTTVVKGINQAKSK